MKRLRSIALWSLAVALASGCRSNLGGLPATGPVALAPNATTNQMPGEPKQPELTMPLSEARAISRPRRCGLRASHSRSRE